LKRVAASDGGIFGQHAGGKDKFEENTKKGKKTHVPSTSRNRFPLEPYNLNMKPTMKPLKTA